MPLVGADYGQMELRVSTAVWKDPFWTSVVGDPDVDMHEQTARNVLHIKGDISTEQRVKAKGANFLTFYGGGAKKLAEDTNCTIEEAREFLDGWHSTYPGLSAMLEADKKRIHENGEFTTIMGWIKPVYVYDQPYRKKDKWEYSPRDAEELRYAINDQVQGPAAQITFAAHVLIDRWLADRTDALMVNHVHDAIYVDCHPRVVDEVSEAMRHLMLNIPLGDIFGFELPVPLKVDIKVADSWGEME